MSRQNPSEKYCPRFGQLAVELGYVSAEQLKQALGDQVDDNLTGRPHRILGAIFFDHGYMSPGQIEEVLNLMFKRVEAEKNGS